LRKRKLEALTAIRAFRSVANEKWRADLAKVIRRFNAHLANLQSNYDAVLAALLATLTPELEHLRYAITSGANRREIVSKFTLTQRISLWILPSLRR
jgi:hypothetical protein